MNMNIIEEYISKYGSLIIIISGLSGTHKSSLAKNIENDFELKLLNLDDYCIKNNDRTFKLSNEISVTDWDHIDTYEWEDFNKDVNKYKKNGVVVYGDNFPKGKLDFKHYTHIHLKISKQNLIEKRKQFVKNNKEKCKELYKYINEPAFNLIINQITYTYYIKYRDESKIDKYLNSDTNSNEQIYDQSFEYLMFYFKKQLDDFYLKNKKN